MNIFKKHYIILPIIFLCICIGVSCVKDVDFDQLEELRLTPVYEIDFVYSDANTADFVGPNVDPLVVIPEITINDTLNYDLFNGDFASDALEQVVLTFIFENTIERGFDFNFHFLDEAEQRLGQEYTIAVQPGLAGTNQPTITQQDIILDAAEIETLNTVTQIVSSITVNNVSLSLAGQVILRSKGTYYINQEL